MAIIRLQAMLGIVPANLPNLRSMGCWLFAYISPIHLICADTSRNAQECRYRNIEKIEIWSYNWAKGKMLIVILPDWIRIWHGISLDWVVKFRAKCILLAEI